MSQVGKLEKVSIQSVWRTEPEFTRWLEQNPDTLSETLGTAIESLTREMSAGDFFVDLVGEDGSGGKVVIENQYGKSDHDHLGKVLTYLAAFEAVTAVWIVETPRPEHVKAFAWLNDASSASFYLVQMQAVRIGDSAPAPLLTLILGPSEERGRVGEIKRTLRERQQVLLEFWTIFAEALKKAGDSAHAHLKPTYGDWLSTAAGITGLGYAYVLLNDSARIELYIDKDTTEAENRELFDRLLSHKEAIERDFGAPLDWEALDGKRAKRIAWRTDLGGIKNRKKWPQLQAELIDRMHRFMNALNPYVSALK
ncbi:MAG: DUF4268 domain-containing protein [Armatimonadetes bacterium]|nr:DUF4268 domain-containing protein [Armatimonadota bacterium]